MKKLGISLLSISLFLISSAGCANLAPPSVQSPVEQILTPPTIVAFSATPAEIIAGDLSRLSWDVIGATSVRIDQDIGEVSASGIITVSPLTNTTYTIIASNDTDSITKSVQVIVNPRPESLPTPLPSSQKTGPSPSLPSTPSSSDAEIKIDEYYGFVQTAGDTPSSCCMIGNIKNNMSDKLV